MRAIAPVLLGIVPFAVISGIAAMGAGLPAGLAFALSVIVYAGSAQLVAVQLIAAGAHALVVLLAALIVNLRFLMYGASLAPHLGPLPAARKCLLAYLLTDQVYAVAISRFQAQGTGEAAGKGRYFLGAGAAMWCAWQAAAAAGIFLGARVPASWSLDFAVPLTFIALVFPAVKDRAAAAAALAAGAAALAAAALPFRLGLVIAALAGVSAGMLAAPRRK